MINSDLAYSLILYMEAAFSSEVSIYRTPWWYILAGRRLQKGKFTYILT
jgi:hypothetical protein